ncbi:hypothetical protein B0H13DRAFT_983127 [Mycena leptocephala]|nr:hypothetical protein B0H13DRAFT_983127 [Mycena leptocephala]
MFQSPSQMRTEFEAAPLQFEEESQDAEPFSQGYVVTEVEEHEQDPENLQDVDAYTMSRSISVEPHHFTVEESFTDHEPDDRGMSIDVVTVDEEMEDDRMMPGEGELGMDIRQEEVAAQDSLSPREEGAEDTRKLTPSLGSPRTEEVDGQTLVEEPQITVQQNGNGGSNIPLPVLADPTVHDLFPSGHPTISFPASLLKAPHMRQESSLFTPLSEAPSAVTTPHSVDYSLPADPESIEVAKTEKADAENTINGQSQATRDGSAEAAEDPVLEAGQAEVMDVSVDADKEIGNSALVIQQDSHTVTDAAATELNQLTPIEEISSSTANEPYEGDIIYATLPDEVTAIAPDLDGAAPLDSAQIEDHVVENESQANGTDLTLVHEEDHLREDSSTATAYPTKMTLAASATPVLEFDPYPYSLSTPGERLDPMEQEEASVSSASTGGKDSEDRTEGEDATSAVTSQENDTGDMDEMQLQYPIEPDVKATPDIQLEAVDAQDGEMDATEAFNGVGDAEGMDLHPITESDVKDIQLETDLLDGEVDAVEALDTTADEVANAVDGEVDAIEASDAADDISEESETDAHGDEDPDYEDSSSSVGGEQDENDIEEAPAADAPAMAPFSLAVQNDAEEAPEEHQPSQEIDESIREPVEASTVSIDVDATPEEITGVPGEENGLVGEKKDVEVSDEVSSSIPDPKTEPSPQLALEPVEAVNSEEGIVGTITPPQAESPPAESASLKRKREHSLKESTSNIGKMAESRLTRRYSLKSNGKGKAKEEYFDDTSSNSSASSAARLLDPGSRGTSRASSVASVRSTKSSVVVTGSSPSLPRVNSIIKAARPPPKLPSPKVLSLPPPAPPPPQLMHAHSHNRAVRPPTFSRHTTHQGLLQRTPSRASVNEDTPIASTSSMSTPAPPRRSTPAANSPVTRSNCRYHKISLPEDDETKTGPRVFFVVPGCSLGDSELMKEEDIQDMGDATMEDAERMINDLDSLHFNSYLIGILRHLVGVDILREQEVYYLPRPGEERLRKPVGRDRSKLRVSSGGSFASDGAMSPVMRSPASVSSRPPTSIAGSSSTASVKTTTRRPKKSDRGSPTPSWGVPSQGDVTDDESPAAKRVRAAEAEGVAAAASGSPLRTRRSKRIDKEAAEYKPDVLEAVEESSDEDADNGRRKKKKRGVKRGRQSEAVAAQEGGVGDDRKTKKLKTRESVGGS